MQTHVGETRRRSRRDRPTWILVGGCAVLNRARRLYHGVLSESVDLFCSGGMQLLLTNDDGIDAPGLAALEDIARRFGRPTIIAPAQALSGCSHRVTTDRPLQVRACGASRYCVDGTPADCVRLAIDQIAPAATWVLSGINAGGNLGVDVYHSGTVAAAREAALHGLPAVAVSHYRHKGSPIDWQRVLPWIEPLLRELMNRRHEPGEFWNVNLPHLHDGQPAPQVVFCPLDPSPLPLRFAPSADGYLYDGRYHQRPRRPGTDIDVCFGGHIAVTELSAFQSTQRE